MGNKQLKLKFWGTRGSNPSAAQNMSTYGGETTCVELRTVKNELVIFDMGTGIISLGNALLKEKNPVKDIHILLSHFHWDHIIGFASFKPVYIEGFNINIYATTFAPGWAGMNTVLPSGSPLLRVWRWHRKLTVIGWTFIQFNDTNESAAVRGSTVAP